MGKLFSWTFALCVVAALPLNSPLLPTYDYIIAGGGPAGLTLAMRLSEDPNVTVLLLEAGPAAHGQPEVEIPGLIGDAIGGQYDWNLTTVPQIYLDGAPRSIPQGRVLGGGTVINGMLWSRGQQGDYQDWVDLGNPGWSWDDLLPYFKKSETYTSVTLEELAEQFSIEEDPSVHGTSGPVNVGFSNYFWNSSAVLFAALNELGVPTAYDPNAGLVAGASFLPLDIDPETKTRVDARKAYYSPYENRTNLWVATRQTVTRILFSENGAGTNVSTVSESPCSSSSSEDPPPAIRGGSGTSIHLNCTNGRGRVMGSHGWRTTQSLMSSPRLTSSQNKSCSGSNGRCPSIVATGVEFAADVSTPRQTISARREVIVAAGALHTPQLLMLSGIGPASSLQAPGIVPVINLPGVGQNLQDHGMVWAWYPYYNVSYPNPTELDSNATFSNDAWIQYLTYRAGPLAAPWIDGVAFPALPFIVNDSSTIVNEATAQSPGQYLASNVDQTVLDGFAAQMQLMIPSLQNSARSAYELLNSNDGVLTVATMRPFSRGAVWLASAEPFDPPMIDPRYGSNPIDLQILEAALAFNTMLIASPSLSTLDPIQVQPPANATSADVVQWIKSRWATEYHPAGTCAMLPLNLGGVVDPNLLVYGTQNLRVVDSSIMPLLPAAHLQAIVYGVAEKAADIIKASWNNRTTAQQDSTILPLCRPSHSRYASTVASEEGLHTTPAVAPSSTPTSSLVPGTVTTFTTVVFTKTVYGR